ncbi:TetR/AcrR family transcriptional regulator [Sphingomonas alpina]|uniref:TetR family transcriptional regulator C-terminal domain-containing protein n=1 Tax=Sphingomonas alpina TaxID=653931 RepID=A0A7H0LMB4_9SPHN|nr:TetR family transcriptional regulator C-terminal domain-containing protein [Sphingomonas alpina]QNQ10817.1 TetR family transcriptional regulator C-terminal domain-containing protein [Sphingomonas alpina]
MARPRLDHNEQRERIARAACDVILEVGLENARLAEIGTRAGVTTGAVQHYFRSKEDLLFFAKNHVYDLLMDKSRAMPEEGAGAERLFFIIHRHLPTSGERIKASRLLEAFRGRAIGNATLLRSQHKRDRIFLDMLHHEIERLKDMGLTHADLDIEKAALGLNAMLDGLGCIVMASPGGFKSLDLAAIVEDYVCATFGVPRPATDAAPIPKRRKGA